MSPDSRWVSHSNVALLTDQYQLTMLQAYWREDLKGSATFSLYARSLPPGRNFLLACGLDEALRYLETLEFTGEALDYLAGMGLFRPGFLDWLSRLRFRGEVRSVAEGTPVFPNEPILEVTASLPEAQIAETFLMNQIHFQTLAASKAWRVVAAAKGRPVLDFGLRRIHGTDAGLKGARAFFIAGIAGTSNVLAGKIYGIPVAGTMAHAYIQAHDREDQAFREFATLYPDTILLVDTYDTLDGVRGVVDLAREWGSDFRVRGIRLDSGNLAELSRAARGILDQADLHQVKIYASGGLDEERIADLIASDAPIDGFGVGTRMSVSSDAPSLDMAYKLTAYGGTGRLKLSPGKPIFPGRIQVFRRFEGGVATGDVIARENEDVRGVPLLEPVMRGGKRLASGQVPLAAIRDHAARAVGALPPAITALAPADPAYPVEVSEGLRDYQASTARRLAHGFEEERAPPG